MLFVALTESGPNLPILLLSRPKHKAYHRAPGKGRKCTASVTVRYRSAWQARRVALAATAERLFAMVGRDFQIRRISMRIHGEAA